MIVKWHLSTGLSGCDREGEVEIEDDATDDDIEDAVREDMWNFLSLTWQKVGADK
jgi:hypothetical protein